MRKLTQFTAMLIALAVSGSAFAWSLKEAAAPYKGTTITVVGLERPSYKAAQELTPQFEKETGIHVKWIDYPYESTLKVETLNFVSRSQQFDVIITDVVWPVTFAAPGWVVPIEHFLNDPKLADPDIDLQDFFPVWRRAFTVGGKLTGLPFDSYAGLLYYNKAMLKKYGFDGPPKTWKELYTQYMPKIYDPDKGIYAYALQSRKGETQTADSFARFLWPWGGSFLNIDQKKVTVSSPKSVAGIEFRQKLMKYMPKGIVADDHAQVVALMAQGKAAMITEWSAFYPTLKQSKIGDDLGVALEPKGPAGRYAAFGGFAYMVSAQVPKDRQNASWLFIQWLTSKEMAKPLIEHGAVVAHKSADTDPAIQKKYPYLKPMVKTWETSTVADWRPQLQCYPRFSEIVSDWGTRIQLGGIPVDKGLDKLNAELSKYMDSTKCWATANNPSPPAGSK